MKPTRWRTLICDLTEECDQKDYPVKQGHPIEAAEDEGDNLIWDASSNLFEAEGGDPADGEDSDVRQFVWNIDRGYHIHIANKVLKVRQLSWVLQ